MESNGFINSWGLYPWFARDGIAAIHPDDRDRFRQLSPYCKVFKCVDVEDGYLKLLYGKETYRVSPVLYSQVASPAFSFGDLIEVKLSDRNATKRKGVVVDIYWHFKKEAAFYFIVDDRGKAIRKRYWKEDLQRDLT